MALVPYIPEDYYDILFPGVQSFTRGLNVVENWATSLFRSLGHYLFQQLVREAHAQIGQAGRSAGNALISYGTRGLEESVARFLESARWVIQGPTNTYNFLRQYYENLTPLNPPRFVQLEKRLRYLDQVPKRQAPGESGEIVDTVSSPGGALQRHTPDWMLPLILGLYGDISPTWRTYIEEEEQEEEYGPKKKRVRYD
ncbi:VP3 [Myocastor coypus polyomavirus 1]|nr:VP3 [Myocastor coypus polyomavirus 1]AXS76443.1 VP3 [Myocastor coypus polyomavirus 1]